MNIAAESWSQYVPRIALYIVCRVSIASLFVRIHVLPTHQKVTNYQVEIHKKHCKIGFTLSWKIPIKKQIYHITRMEPILLLEVGQNASATLTEKPR